MERDPYISKLIREGGMISAPAGFTKEVMGRVGTEPVSARSKPLIGRTGRIFILLFVVATIVLAMVYGEPGESGILESLGMNAGWSLPQWEINLNFLSDFSNSTGIVAGVVALFILVLSDAGLNRRRFVF